MLSTRFGYRRLAFLARALAHAIFAGVSLAFDGFDFGLSQGGVRLVAMLGTEAFRAGRQTERAASRPRW